MHAPLAPPIARFDEASFAPAFQRSRTVVAMDAGEVYRTLSPGVLGYLRGQKVADPEDLLGEVFYHVTRSLPTFVGDEADLRRWVFTIARNRVIDDLRKRRNRPWTVALERFDRTAEEPPQADDDLIDALRQLTPEQREVITLRFIADLPLEDVADITGRTIGAVKSMQHRALGQLARRLDPTQGEEEPDG